MSFEKSLQFALRWEGVLSEDPLDPGGITKFGISKKAYPNLDIKNLTIAQAKEIYFRDYWKKARCDRLPYPLSLVVFDYAVNAGTTRAIRELQGVVGAAADGVWGPKTEQKIAEAIQSRGVKVIALRLLIRRGQFYIDIVMRNHSQLRYLRGWMSRVFDLMLELEVPSLKGV